MVVGRELISIPFGIMHGDLFAALFGRFEVRFTVMTDDPQITYAGPSFRDMLVQGSKHRRLGAVAGLITRGFMEPGLHLYAIHNPYAFSEQRLSEEALAGVHQFCFQGARGYEQDGRLPVVGWERLRHLAWQPEVAA
ncbi:MAG: hypothetical protein ACRDIC_03015 [bacterium]